MTRFTMDKQDCYNILESLHSLFPGLFDGDSPVDGGDLVETITGLIAEIPLPEKPTSPRSSSIRR